MMNTICHMNRLDELYCGILTILSKYLVFCRCALGIACCVLVVQKEDITQDKSSMEITCIDQ
jgi:hypothetical protein